MQTVTGISTTTSKGTETKFAYSGNSHVYIFEQVSSAFRLANVIPFMKNTLDNAGKDMTDEFVQQKAEIFGVFEGTIFEDET
jgi:hypothetical protein